MLGSGKGLAPPSPAPVSRSSSPYAPSDVGSTVYAQSGNSTPNSISPPSSTALPPDFPQDLAANVSLAGPSNGAASGELLCPICGEEMVQSDRCPICGGGG